MKRIARMLIVLIGLGACAMGITMLGSAPAYTQQGPPGLDVIVRNTPDVNVVNNPLVSALQSGPWNMGINGSVNIGNSATSPVPTRDVDNPARQPFQWPFVWFVPPGLASEFSPSVTVPAGKCLVIETVSAQAVADVSTFMRLRILTTANGQLVGHFIDVENRGTAGGLNNFHGTHAVRIYADPGTTVRFGAGRGDTSGYVDVNAAISGYFVDVP